MLGPGSNNSLPFSVGSRMASQYPHMLSEAAYAEGPLGMDRSVMGRSVPIPYGASANQMPFSSPAGGGGGGGGGGGLLPVGPLYIEHQPSTYARIAELENELLNLHSMGRVHAGPLVYEETSRYYYPGASDYDSYQPMPQLDRRAYPQTQHNNVMMQQGGGIGLPGYQQQSVLEGQMYQRDQAQRDQAFLQNNEVLRFHEAQAHQQAQETHQRTLLGQQQGRGQGQGVDVQQQDSERPDPEKKLIHDAISVLHNAP